MENDIFINLAINDALNKYKVLKETNDYSIARDFLVYAIGILIYIYGEENVFDLFDKNDYQSFDYLLNKYNVDSYYVTKFYDDFDKFYTIDIKNKTLNTNEENPYFIYIQEDLINMFLAKYSELKMDEKKLDIFRDMLFTPVNNDSFIQEYNQKMTDNQDYILNYYEAKVNEVLHPYEFTLERENIISDEVYEKFGLTKEKREKLSFKDLEAINNKIFSYFKVSPIDPNVNKKLLESIEKHNSKGLSNKIFPKSKIARYTLIWLGIFIIVVIIIFISLKSVGVVK